MFLNQQNPKTGVAGDLQAANSEEAPNQKRNASQTLTSNTPQTKLFDSGYGFAQGEEFQAAGSIGELDRPYLAKNWFHPAQVGMLVAPPAKGKTAVIAAISAHISLGHNFAGLRVKRSAVYYLAPEDPNGVKSRANPYLNDLAPNHVPFSIVSRIPNFQSTADIDAIIVDVNQRKDRWSTKHALVVIDTTNLAIGDSDENSATAIGKVISNARRIAVECESYVLFIHHTAHGDQTRGRGSSAFRANIDDEFLLKRASASGKAKLVELKPTKQKNCELQDPLTFEIESYEIGKDSEGEEVTVPKAVPLLKPKATVQTAVNSDRPPARPVNAAKQRQQDVLRVLKQLNDQSPSVWHDTKTIGALTGESFGSVRHNRESFRKTLKAALDSNIEAGSAERTDKTYRLVQSERSTPDVLGD